MGTASVNGFEMHYEISAISRHQSPVEGLAVDARFLDRIQRRPPHRLRALPEPGTCPSDRLQRAKEQLGGERPG